MASEIGLLFERPDFADLVIEAADFHGIPNPAIVEKDYYVTEALRLISQGFGDRVIFKGGTSLSKGWNLIKRFSEDVDLYIDPEDRGTKARNTLLKSLASSVDDHPGLTIDDTRTGRIDGLARSTTYIYTAMTRGSGISASVLLEAGIQSGTFPTEVRPISSLLGSFLKGQNVALESEELESFDLQVLHFRRTFVEKLYALHDKVARGYLQGAKPIGGYARHYYDVAVLLEQRDVNAMLESQEFAEIARDYRRLTSRYFPQQALPAGMNLADSPALFPTGDLIVVLAIEYEQQCDVLCYGPYPAFSDLLGALDGIRSGLNIDLDAKVQ